MNGFVGSELSAACRDWDARQGTRRLFERDATLWTGGDEARWLDWLDLSATSAARQAATTGERLRTQARRDGLKHVLLVGMGGSSLCPEVLSRVFAPSCDGLPLAVIDSVDPARLRAVLGKHDLASALVIVASKSGSTLEPNLVKAWLSARLREISGAGFASRQLVAITDPGSNLDREARSEGWRAVVPGVPGIGGRYSALSPFGIVPAALLGVDVAGFLDRAEAMMDRCRTEPAETNPGVRLGLALGGLARAGRDKLTLLPSETFAPVGAWIEQLVAESTGKRGTGIVPVDGEPALDPAACGADRVVVTIGGSDGDGGGNGGGASEGARFAEHGHPVLACDVPEPLALGACFVQWEIATAVAGAILGIHPFDQPDVEASKEAARARLSGGGDPPAPRVVLAEDDGVTLEADEATAAHLPRGASLAEVMAAHAGSVEPPGWIGLLAWRCEAPEVASALLEIRRRLGRAGRVATTLGVGPRFLHSTGQLHKGGPDTGTFLQVIGPPGEDLPVPGMDASFGRVLLAQAEGDFDVLAARGRRVLLARLADPRAATALLRAVIR